MATSIFGDIKHVFTIMRLEFHKNWASRRFLGFMAFVILFVSVIALAPNFLDGWSYPDYPYDMMQYYIGPALDLGSWIFIPIVSLISILSAIIFSSTSLRSEYKERTGLLLFSKPIRKGSIFVGKFLTAFLTSVFMMILYCLLAVAATYIITDGIYDGVWLAILSSIPYIFAITGIVFFIGSLFKRGSAITLISFSILLLAGFLCDIFTTAEMINEYWFNLFYANDLIGYSYLWGTTDHLSEVLIDIGYMSPIESVLVMLGWGFLTGICSFLIYRTKSF